MVSPAANLHGPALIGIFVNTILYGICMIQTYNYYHMFPEDRKPIKYYVGFLFAADTVNTVLVIWWIYDILVNNFANPEILMKLDWLLGTDPAMNSILAISVQLFFAYRVKVISGKLWLAAVIAFISALGFCGGMAFAISFNWAENLLSLATERVPGILSAIWLAPSAAADILITISLTWFLHKSRSGYKPTETILNKIIRLTIANGFITMTVAVIELCLFLGKPGDGLHIGFNFPLGKLYSVSALSTLHSRRHLRELRNKADSTTNGTNGGFAPHILSNTRGGKTQPEVFVSVEMDTRFEGHPNETTRDGQISAWSEDKKIGSPV